ncbi:MAG: TlpA family protein disulfide reductase [Bradymonadia bacterium]
MHLVRHSVLIATLGFGCTATPISVNGEGDASLRVDVSMQVNDAALTLDAQSLTDIAIANDNGLDIADDATILDSGTDGGNPADAATDEPDVSVVESDAGMDAGFELPSCRVDGPTPPEFCTGTSETQFHCDSFGGPSIEGPTTIGSEQPIWALQDLQPQSCGFQQYYGLDAFHGKPTMVVLLWAGCGFCQAQTEKLQQMHYELQAEGKDVHFVIIDQSAENPPIEYLTDRCNFPILQDESDINVWGL